MYHKLPRTTFKNITKVLAPEDITNAEQFWILQAQKIMHEDLKKEKYKRLCPRKHNDGIYTVGGCSQRWMEMRYNKQELILLPYEHCFSNSMRNTFIKEDTLGYSQQPVKFDHDSG